MINFIQYLILRNYGETISKKHILNAYREFKAINILKNHPTISKAMDEAGWEWREL